MKALTTRTWLASAAVLLLSAAGQAATIGFDPSDVSGVGAGDNLSVDLVVSDLGGEIVSAYDVDILYDDAVLQPLSVGFSSELGGVGDALFDADIPVPGVLDLAAVSFLSDAELLAMQGGDSVVLASIHFAVLSAAGTSIDILLDQFNDVKGAGNQVLELRVEPASVNPIPEPTAAAVFGIGMLLVGATTSRRRAVARS